MTEILALALGYLIGSIPFGLVLCLIAGLGDIRKIGSGNIGATNVLRTGNKPLALLTLLLDSGKGAAAVILAHQFAGTSGALAAGLAAIIGHIFPVWLKFKGGKGVATTLGTLLALAPWVGVTACATWLVTAAIFRFSSLAALIAMLSAPISSYLLYHDVKLSIVSAIVAAVVWARHHENIKRLLKGQEPKIGKKKQDAQSS